jgi:hypothetical protein
MKMMTIELSDADYRYLAHAPFLTLECQALIQAAVKKESFWLLSISEDEAEEIREQLQDQFLYCGLDEDYVPNAEGKQLDALIDAFFTG